MSSYRKDFQFKTKVSMDLDNLPKIVSISCVIV